jgi:hypothetical protein
MKNKLTASVLLGVLISLCFSCHKTDWRDNYIGSYNAQKEYQYAYIDLLTGISTGFSKALDSLALTQNVQLFKNDYADQLTVKVQGAYLMDVDKDGHCNKANASFFIYSDSVFINWLIPADTIHYGRYHIEGKKN